MSNILFVILGFLCRRNNYYQLKVNLIEENIMYNGDKDEENIINIIIIPPEEPIPISMYPQESQHSQGLQKKKSLIQNRLK